MRMKGLMPSFRSSNWRALTLVARERRKKRGNLKSEVDTIN
jgi:hypothetical protein